MCVTYYICVGDYRVENISQQYKQYCLNIFTGAFFLKQKSKILDGKMPHISRAFWSRAPYGKYETMPLPRRRGERITWQAQSINIQCTLGGRQPVLRRAKCEIRSIVSGVRFQRRNEIEEGWDYLIIILPRKKSIRCSMLFNEQF